MSEPPPSADSMTKLRYANDQFMRQNAGISADNGFTPAEIGMTDAEFLALKPERRNAIINEWVLRKKAEDDAA